MPSLNQVDEVVGAPGQIRTVAGDRMGYVQPRSRPVDQRSVSVPDDAAASDHHLEPGELAAAGVYSRDVDWSGGYPGCSANTWMVPE